MWQLDFSEFETATGSVWRIAGCADYFSKYEFGWHLATTYNAGDAIVAVEVAIAEAERLAADTPLAEQLTDPMTGKINRIKLVTDNEGAFKGSRFAVFIASRPELLHIRTRRRSPGQNGVRERVRITEIRTPLPARHRRRPSPRRRGRVLPPGVQPRPAARSPP
ncbi:hypothetical protein [Saccharopolyspora shandongensis]|uniref:hypothetical protein n=1 Tax=Saccharopolyspora shandongensis TaxID=418495 RepID=UPI0033EB54B2